MPNPVEPTPAPAPAPVPEPTPTPAPAPTPEPTPAPVAPAPVAPEPAATLTQADVDTAVKSALAAASVEAAEKARVQSAVETAAGNKELRAYDPKAVAALIDSSKLKVTADAVTGVDAEIARVKAAYPGLFYGPGNADGGARGDAVVEDANTWFRRQMSAGKGA